MWYLALSVLIINLCIWASILNVHAETPLLSAEDAFPFTVESTTEFYATSNNTTHK
jgi:thioredoxin:protein disulfide reductase